MISNGTDSGQKRSYILPGASPSTWLYRGYVLGYSSLTSTEFMYPDDESTIQYESVTGSNVPEFLFQSNGSQVDVRFGNNIISGFIENIGGKYGSRGIDTILYDELGGIPIIINGTDIRG